MKSRDNFLINSNDTNDIDGPKFPFSQQITAEETFLGLGNKNIALNFLVPPAKHCGTREKVRKKNPVKQ